MKLLLATALVLLLSIEPAGSAEIKPEARSFPAFWIQFKAAVAKGDKAAIAGMTKFPFLYESKQLSKNAFMKQCDVIFSEKVQRCFRNAKPIKDDTRGSYSVFCGETIFLFEKGKGEYQLAELGVND
jgi:hypothetical protein